MSREVWHFEDAAWINLRCDLRACSWTRLGEGSVDSAVNYFLDLLQEDASNTFLTAKYLLPSRRTHGWMTCVVLLYKPTEIAISIGHFDAARDHCAQVINDRLQNSVNRFKEKFNELKKCDK